MLKINENLGKMQGGEEKCKQTERLLCEKQDT